MISSRASGPGISVLPGSPALSQPSYSAERYIAHEDE